MPTKKSAKFVDDDWTVFNQEVTRLAALIFVLALIYVYCGESEYFYTNPSASNDIWLKLLSAWKYDVRFLYVLLGYAFNMVPFLLVCLYYDTLYKFQLFAKYRIQSPYEKYPASDLVTATVQHDLLLFTVGTPLLFFFTFNVDSNFDAMPSLWTMCIQILGGIYTFDLGFYVTHRLLHTKWLYKYHKLHHEYKTSISWAAIYSSGFEFLFSSIPPTAAPVILFKMHPVSALLYYLYRNIETAVGHSGYDLPFWCSPLGVMRFLPGHYDQERLHDFHHSSNDGCFGFYFIDAAFGTHQTFRKHYYSSKAKKH